MHLGLCVTRASNTRNRGCLDDNIAGFLIWKYLAMRLICLNSRTYPKEAVVHYLPVSPIPPMFDVPWNSACTIR